MSDLGERLVSAAAQALLPLVTRLLVAGVPFGQLEGRLRELFVEVAEAEFALGRFPTAAEAARRAFPDLGTPAEARVPEGWRRLYYPIEEKGYIAERAR